MYGVYGSTDCFCIARNWMNTTPSQRWQNWINRVHDSTKRRARPQRFTPPLRCIEEQCLSGNLLLLDEEGRMLDGGKEVGRVRR